MMLTLIIWLISFRIRYYHLSFFSLHTLLCVNDPVNLVPIPEAGVNFTSYRKMSTRLFRVFGDICPIPHSFFSMIILGNLKKYRNCMRYKKQCKDFNFYTKMNLSLNSILPQAFWDTLTLTVEPLCFAHVPDRWKVTPSTNICAYSLKNNLDLKLHWTD